MVLVHNQILWSQIVINDGAAFFEVAEEHSKQIVLFSLEIQNNLHSNSSEAEGRKWRNLCFALYIMLNLWVKINWKYFQIHSSLWWKFRWKQRCQFTSKQNETNIVLLEVSLWNKNHSKYWLIICRISNCHRQGQYWNHVSKKMWWSRNCICSFWGGNWICQSQIVKIFVGMFDDKI